MVLAVDPERERISLGIKQLDQDPFATWMAEHPRGCLVKGIVKEVDARGAVIELAEGVEGYLRASDIKEERVEDATRELSVGDEVEAKFISLDRKNRTLSLSIRAKEDAELAEALRRIQAEQRLRRHDFTGRLAEGAAGTGILIRLVHREQAKACSRPLIVQQSVQ